MQQLPKNTIIETLKGISNYCFNEMALKYAGFKLIMTSVQKIFWGIKFWGCMEKDNDGDYNSY